MRYERFDDTVAAEAVAAGHDGLNSERVSCVEYQVLICSSSPARVTVRLGEQC